MISINHNFSQAKLEELEGETSSKGAELKREMGQRAELQAKISTTRNALDMAKNNVSSLETEVLALSKRNFYACIDHCHSSS